MKSLAPIALCNPLGVALSECSGSNLQDFKPVGVHGAGGRWLLPAERTLPSQLWDVSGPAATLKSSHEVEPVLA